MLKSVILAALLVAVASTCQIKAQKRIASTAVLKNGAGLDSLTGEMRSTCVVLNPEEEQNKDSVSLDVDYVTNAESMYRSVESNASASFGVGIGSSVSISFGMTAQQFFSVNSTVLAIVEKVTTKSLSMPGPYSPIAGVGPFNENFRAKCGTEFITETVKGGEFMVLLRAEDITSSEKNQFRADMQTAIAGNPASAHYAEAVERVTKNTQFRVHLVRVGAQGDLPVLSVPDLIKYAREFPTEVRKSGNQVFVLATPYSAAGIFQTPDLSERMRETVLYQLGANYDAASDLKLRINEVLSNHLAYSFRNKSQELTALDSKAVELVRYANETVSSANSCLNRAKTTCDLSMIKPVPDPRLPLLLSAVGGCFSWTDDYQYCLEYRIQGTDETTMNYTALMKPPGPWAVRTTGRVDRMQYPPLGDISRMTGDIELTAQGQSVQQHQDWGSTEKRYFDVSIPNVTATAEGIKGSLSVIQCFWVVPQHCTLVDQTLTIASPAALLRSSQSSAGIIPPTPPLANSIAARQ